MSFNNLQNTAISNRVIFNFKGEFKYRRLGLFILLESVIGF